MEGTQHVEHTCVSVYVKLKKSVRAWVGKQVSSLSSQTALLTAAGERWACNVFYWCSGSPTALRGTGPSPGWLGGEWQPQLLSLILRASSCPWGRLLRVWESAAVMEAKVFFLTHHKLPCAFHTNKEIHMVQRDACTYTWTVTLPAEERGNAL